jgi:hypothetical protein
MSRITGAIEITSPAKMAFAPARSRQDVSVRTGAHVQATASATPIVVSRVNAARDMRLEAVEA